MLFWSIKYNKNQAIVFILTGKKYYCTFECPKPNMKVEVFIPCFTDQLKPETAQSVFRVLNHLGVETHYPETQTCCGLMAYRAGYWDEVKILGEKFINEFSSDRYVVMPSAACAHMVRENYNRFFYNTSLHLDYKKLQTKIFEFSDFLINVLHVSAWKGKFKAKIFVHYCSNASIDYGIKNEPGELLGMVKGIELVDIPGIQCDCGFEAGFAFKHPDLSTDMALELLTQVFNAGADYLVTLETSCMVQLESVARKNNLQIKIVSVADILAESLRNSDLPDDEFMTLG